MWQMSQFSLQMGMAPVIIAGLLQGFGLGCTQVPLNIIALSTLPRHIMTQGTAIRSLMRNLGGSVGISILVATLDENTQTVHSRLGRGSAARQSARASALSNGTVQPRDAGRNGGA
jgi:MFS transporter, DHA2 family, multidrug resistance protein